MAEVNLPQNTDEENETPRAEIESPNGDMLRGMVTDALSDPDAERILQQTEAIGEATGVRPLHVLTAISLEQKETGGKLTVRGLLDKLQEFKQTMEEDLEKPTPPPPAAV